MVALKHVGKGGGVFHRLHGVQKFEWEADNMNLA